jgi:fumarate reductase subunit D
MSVDPAQRGDGAAGLKLESPGLEPLFWGLFSAGGVIAAFLVPLFVVLNLAGLLTGPRLHAFARGLPGKLVLAALLTLPFFHCAHRLKHVLMDLGLHGAEVALSFICYGGALAASIAGIIFVLRV